MSRLRTLTVEHLDCPRNYDIIFCRISANPSTAICVRSRSPQLVVPYSHQTADLEKLSVWHEPSRMTVVKLVGATSAICTTSEAPASRDNNLLTHVDLSRIQGVWVECDSGQGSLLPLLRRMTALTTLAVYTDKGAAVLERLTIVGDLDPPLCPNLSTLHLLVNEEGIHNGAHIHEFAVTRFRQGCPLLTVIVETMLTVDEEGILTSLESYVGEVRFKSVKRLSTMTLPAICSEKRHDFWDAAWT
ncbi:hypothetical protein CERSUDRAFT_114464 [Gelatoporia subvermispora B]|uniref:F-box domain-containing protein n=1 Tax=Ceriporiopsis subvermispora (strain B) TaxID=914234 RepID=M2RG70_CERS8|nr:hypothetical protein CERSUDRAFT_114464 [Gelatoporia subvermispora B]